jgi:putative ATP-dependent endonuclease of OLD family
MRIAAVSWENFRRLPDGEIEVRNNLVLVGANDTGKSSVLRAMNICLGMAHSQLTPAVSARDFTCRPPAAWDHLRASSASSMGPPFRQ